MKQKNEDVEKIERDCKIFCEGLYLRGSQPSENIDMIFITFIRQAFSAGQENMREKMMKCIPEEITDRKLTTHEQTWYHNAGFNSCRTQMIQNIKEII